ncbi:tripartite tricarboxylate transporter substrate binding protein [Pseudohalocynthiibacter aestuariivivens]|nr:tripartite tricarboxylate transporter substrate binding protein [Pseudohalocynthiibacter aestuariivivens]QIE46848.1 tripartite tricarboxylate transporter substrate binding protein [Pseudohalocynthiibacter aestuariivivens]
MKKTYVLAAALALAPSVALAEWPSDKPITLVVGYSAGGGTDILARTMAPFLEKYIEGASFVVINKPGPGGEYGFTETANADPDGYTIGFMNAPAFITLPYERETRYNFDMFAPIANLVTAPATLSVPDGSSIESLDEFVAEAKAAPNALTIGHQGYGGSMHLSLEGFLDMTETEVTQVPFPGIPPAATALLGGHIAGLVVGTGEASNIGSDDNPISILGVMSRERMELFPDIPTFAEQGYEIYSGSDRGFAAPKGTSEDIIATIGSAIEKTLEDPEFLKAAEEQKLPLNYMNQADYTAYLKDLNTRIGNLWETNPWR